MTTPGPGAVPAMSDLLICLNPSRGLASNAEGPVFDGPKDEPVWCLFVEAEDGDHWETYKLLGADLTYQGAVDLADALDKPGRIIGFRGPGE
jgi:hypothetical protein